MKKMYSRTLALILLFLLTLPQMALAIDPSGTINPGNNISVKNGLPLILGAGGEFLVSIETPTVETLADKSKTGATYYKNNLPIVYGGLDNRAGILISDFVLFDGVGKSGATVSHGIISNSKNYKTATMPTHAGTATVNRITETSGEATIMNRLIQAFGISTHTSNSLSADQFRNNVMEVYNYPSGTLDTDAKKLAAFKSVYQLMYDLAVVYPCMTEYVTSFWSCSHGSFGAHDINCVNTESKFYQNLRNGMGLTVVLQPTYGLMIQDTGWNNTDFWTPLSWIVESCSVKFGVNILSNISQGAISSTGRQLVTDMVSNAAGHLTPNMGIIPYANVYNSETIVGFDNLMTGKAYIKDDGTVGFKGTNNNSLVERVGLSGAPSRGFMIVDITQLMPQSPQPLEGTHQFRILEPQNTVSAPDKTVKHTMELNLWQSTTWLNNFNDYVYNLGQAEGVGTGGLAFDICYQIKPGTWNAGKTAIASPSAVNVTYQTSDSGYGLGYPRPANAGYLARNVAYDSTAGILRTNSFQHTWPENPTYYELKLNTGQTNGKAYWASRVWVDIKNKSSGAVVATIELGKQNADVAITAVTTPPPSGELDIVFWANKSEAHAESKQGTYSDNRSSEKWEAMAGVPHDQSMYINGGASAALMAVARTTATTASSQWQVTGNPATDGGLRSKSTSGNFSYSANASSCSVYPYATHCSSVCNGAWCHGCRLGGCHGGCRGHTYSSGSVEDGTYTRWTEYYGACHNCSGGSCPDRTRSDSRAIEQFSLYYYAIDSFKYYKPTQMTFNSNYFPDTKTFTPTGLNVTKSEIAASFALSNASKNFSYATCGILKNNYTTDRDYHYKNEAHPRQTFTPQQFAIKDVNGVIYNFLGTTSLSFTGYYDSVKNTLVYKNNNSGRSMDKSRISDNTRHLYADEAPNLAASRTNWMPHTENWNQMTKVNVRGYNGIPGSQSRNVGGTLFYGAGYQLKTLLTNGTYTANLSPARWDLVQSSGSNAAILPSFDNPTVLRKTNTVVEPTHTVNASYSSTGPYSTVPNSIVVHTPTAVRESPTAPLLLLGQDYIYPETILSSGSILPNHVRLGQSFRITWNHRWEVGADTSVRGIENVTSGKWGLGNLGYVVGLDTLPWIKMKGITFSFEVIYNGTRYAANTWIEVPVTEMASDFHCPISNAEIESATYTTKVIAKNSPDNSLTSVDTDPNQNYTRYTGLRAKHGATRSNYTSVLGTIGNFAIQYTTDPNWKDYFATGYIGTAQNMFGFASSNPQGRFLDPFETMPLLNKAPHSAKPITAGGSNNNNNEPLKMGYPIYYSMQTVGNYKNASVKVDANYRVVHFDAGVTDYIDVDLYYRDGNTYKKLFPAADGAIVTTNTLNDTSYPVTGLERNNSTSYGGISFGTGNKTNIYGISEYRIPISLRTLIGNTKDYRYPSGYPAGGSHSLSPHISNAQRWHGMIYLPSSTVAVPRGSSISDSTILKGDGYMLTCELKFTTTGASPYNLTTGDNTMFDPSVPGINTVVVPPGANTPVTIEFPPNTVAVYDLNKNSAQDAGTSGTH